MSKRELRLWFGAVVIVALCMMFSVIAQAESGEIAAPAAATQAASTQSVELTDPTSIVNTIVSAIQASQWQLAGFACLFGLLWVLRFMGAKILGFIRKGTGNISMLARAIYLDGLLAWIGTDRGGAVLALLMGAVLAVVNGLIAGDTDVLSLFKDGLVLSLGSMGMWSGGRRILPGKLTGRTV